MDTKQTQPCSWCSHHGVRGDGDGQFRDVDVDFSSYSYSGIPICGGCGGLGIEFDSDDFKARVARIRKLRFEFHPTDGLPEPPTSVPYMALKALIREVEELTQKYGLGTEKSFARSFIAADSEYREYLPVMESCIAEEISAIKRSTLDLPAAAIEPVREALISLYSGEINKGEEIYKQMLAKFPEDSRLCHDFGIFLLMFQRDKKTSLEYILKSTTLEPKKAVHMYQAAKLLILSERSEEAWDYLSKMKKASDFIGFSRNNKGLNETMDLLQRRAQALN